MITYLFVCLAMIFLGFGPKELWSRLKRFCKATRARKLHAQPFNWLTRCFVGATHYYITLAY